MATDTEEIQYFYTGDISSFKKATQQVSGLLDDYEAQVSKITGKIQKVASAAAGLFSGKQLAKMVKESISYTENLNLFTVAMGEAYDESLEFVDAMAELYGMDPSSLMRYAGNFYQLADAISMPSEAASALSLGLTKATNDLASLFNMPMEQVFENLSSGMQGMSRAVRKYGIDIRTTTLQQTALSLGITENVKTMSEANRMGLRFVTMMRQANNASGDFARTIETPANQLRIFREQMAQLGRAIGDLFIGPLSVALQYINGFVMALRMAINFVSSLFGILGAASTVGTAESMEEVSDSIGSIATGAGAAAKELKSMLAPFDELNVMQEPQLPSEGGGAGLSDMGTLDPAILAAIEDMQWGLESVRMKAVEVRDALLQFFGFTVEAGQILSWDSTTFEQNLIKRFPKWTKTIKTTFSKWSSIVSKFRTLFEGVATTLSQVWANLVGDFESIVNDESVSAFIDSLDKVLGSLSTTISTNSDDISLFVTRLMELGVAFAGLSFVAGLVEPVLQFIGVCVSAISPFRTAITTITLVVAAIQTLRMSSDSFAKSFDGLMSSVVVSAKTIFSTFGSVLEYVWSQIDYMWKANLKPTVTRIGDAMAPVVNTIRVVWESLVPIITGVLSAVVRAWDSIIAPVISRFVEAIGQLASTFKNLWSTVVGPIVERIASSLSNLWVSTLQPIVENIIDIIGELAGIVLSLWNGALLPLTNWIISTLGPVFTSIFNKIWEVVEWVFRSIGTVVEGVLQTLRGLLTFVRGTLVGDWSTAWGGIRDAVSGVLTSISPIMNALSTLINKAKELSPTFAAVWGNLESAFAGVKSTLSGLIGFITGTFAGNWAAAWQGMVNTFRGIWATLTGLFKAPINAVIGVINSFLYSMASAINSAIGQINRISVTIPKWVPGVGGKYLGFNIGYVGYSSIPYLAEGAVVTGPTLAMIGEGKYDEAVLPLGNSPQMAELVSAIADATSSGQAPVYVEVSIGSEAIENYVYRATRRAQLQTNGGM